MKVIWLPAAKCDRAELLNFIASENPGAAARMDKLFSGAAARLANFPLAGRPGKIAGTRELIPHRNYRLVYEIDLKTVWILALIHVARQWPPASRDKT